VTEYSPAKTGENPRGIPRFSKLRVSQAMYLKDNEHNGLYLTRKYARILILSLDIVRFSNLTVFLELCSRKTVRRSEQKMSADKYLSVFSRQMEGIVYITLKIIYARPNTDGLQESKPTDHQRRFSRDLGPGNESKPREKARKGINRKMKLEIKNEVRTVIGSLTQLFCATEERLCLRGPKGDKGGEGTRGIPGVRGERGLTGPSGIKGQKGKST